MTKTNLLGKISAFSLSANTAPPSNGLLVSGNFSAVRRTLKSSILQRSGLKVCLYFTEQDSYASSQWDPTVAFSPGKSHPVLFSSKLKYLFLREMQYRNGLKKKKGESF